MAVWLKSKMDIQCPCSPCGAAYVFKLFGRLEGLAGSVEQESTWPAEMNRVIGIADQAAISIGIIGWRG